MTRIVGNILAAGACFVIFLALSCLILQIKPAIVTSGSMEPTIPVGSMILIEKRNTDVEIGDIVVVQAGGASVAHRIIRTTGNGYVTKGDNNTDEDPGIVTDEMIMGTVRLWIPGAGYIIRLPSRILAYLTSVDTAENSFSVGNSRIQISEEFLPEDLQPGVSIAKKVNIINNGRNPCELRVLACLSDMDMQEYIDIDYNTAAWELKEDGYYYYRDIVEAEGITEPLFTKVSVSAEAPAAELKDFQIYIYAESSNAEPAG